LKRKSILARHGHRAAAHHEGLCHQFGFPAHGFKLAPARGAAMAEPIVSGGSRTRIGELDINPFFFGSTQSS
jgi:sarcosine oxidase, subunit beta